MRGIGIGEILRDEPPSGRDLGGAPFNVVAHLARLGHETAYLTAVRSDQAGHTAIAGARSRTISVPSSRMRR